MVTTLWLMSLPQIFAGDNIIRFKVEDASQVRSDINATYCWQTEDGQKTSHIGLDSGLSRGLGSLSVISYREDD